MPWGFNQVELLDNIQEDRGEAGSATVDENLTEDSLYPLHLKDVNIDEKWDTNQQYQDIIH